MLNECEFCKIILTNYWFRNHYDRCLVAFFWSVMLSGISCLESDTHNINFRVKLKKWMLREKNYPSHSFVSPSLVRSFLRFFALSFFLFLLLRHELYKWSKFLIILILVDKEDNGFGRLYWRVTRRKHWVWPTQQLLDLEELNED